MPGTGTADNRRIARNTAFLYVRMIVTLLVTLYTSRVVLATLGIDDYGIYNVVGGIVTMFAFLNNSMASATQRFLTVELGRGDMVRMRKVFSAALHIHVAIGLLIVLLAETAGLWFLNSKLVIAPERMDAARWVYQFSVATFFVNVIQVPYNASIIAHERMGIYAYVSIAEALLKLLMVFVLTVVPYDKLVTYSLMMFLIQVGIRVFYQVWCRRNYAECRSGMVRDWGLYREMSGFAGWNILGSLAWVMKDQGINIVLNLFFGTAVNAARGVASQVSTSVSGFVSNFQVALNPQITKCYVADNRKEMETLVFRGLRFSFVLLYFIALPLLLNVDFVLGIWLKEVPDYASLFVILIIADSLVCTLSGGPLMTSLAATGRIRNYQVTVSCIILLTVPAAYFLLDSGLPPQSVYYVTIFFSLVSGFVRFLFARHQIGFSLRGYMSGVAGRVAVLLLLSLPVPLLLRHVVFTADSWVSFLVISAASVIFTAVPAWTVTLDHAERDAFRKMIAGRFRKKNTGEKENG